MGKDVVKLVLRDLHSVFPFTPPTKVTVTDSNTVNNVNMIVMAFEGFLFVGLAVWYVWSVTQKASSRFWIEGEYYSTL